MTSSGRALAQHARVAEQRLESFHIGTSNEPGVDLASDQRRPPTKRKRIDSHSERYPRHPALRDRYPSPSERCEAVGVSSFSPPKREQPGDLPTDPSEPPSLPPQYILQRGSLIVTVLLNEKPLTTPHLISAYECATFLKFLLAIKKSYAFRWHLVPSTTTTGGIRVSFPHQPNSYIEVDSQRAYHNWYKELRLYFAEPNNIRYSPEVFVLLQSEGGNGSCFFTAGNIEPDTDRLAADRVLGIGRKDSSDSAVTISKNYLEGLERELVEKEEELDTLREENGNLKTLLEENHIEVPRERKQVGGLRLPGRRPSMKRKDD